MHATDAGYIGISQTGRLVAVDQTVTAISHLVELESMSRDRIRGKLPPREPSAARQALARESKGSEGQWPGAERPQRRIDGRTGSVRTRRYCVVLHSAAYCGAVTDPQLFLD
jgi:hypothetical protein